MKKILILIQLILFTTILTGQNAGDETNPVFTDEQKDFIVRTICGVWEIEKREFTDGSILLPPDVRGYLVITRDFWTQTEAQVVEKGGVKPFSGSYFGKTDLAGSAGKEMVMLTIQVRQEADKNYTVTLNTEESIQEVKQVITDDSVTQFFTGGGSVTMKNDRFSQERKNLYTTYWKRIQKPGEVFRLPETVKHNTK